MQLRSKPPTAIVIHHEAGAIQDTVEKIRKYHMEVKGWKDIAYNAIIEYPKLNVKLMDLIKPGREEQYIPAHCLGFNEESLGICLVGNWSTLMPHPAQLDALVAQLHIWMDKYKIPPQNIFTHREKWVDDQMHSKTECPGNALHSLVVKIRAALIQMHDSAGALNAPDKSEILQSPSSPQE